MNLKFTDFYELYDELKPEIKRRLEEFEKNWRDGNNERIFAELSFCLLTPQSKAKTCWKVIEKLVKSKALFHGDAEEILSYLDGVRFKEKKAEYIVYAREKFSYQKRLKIKEILSDLLKEGVNYTREWLVENIKGMGYKEASHFLRNIGFGKDIAILDRHILNTLVELGKLSRMPKSLTKKRYIIIEKLMKNLSREMNIPMDHIDLLFWAYKTGEVFK